MASSPLVLLVDDEPATQRNRLQTVKADLTAARYEVASPEELTLEGLREAQLVLVDYRLDQWTENLPSNGPCHFVPDGIALAAVLQQHARVFDHPIAFALHSEHRRELTDPFLPEPRVHLLARTYNLEWAFVKSPTGGPAVTLKSAGLLAGAVKQLPTKWPPDAAGIRQMARKLLNLPDQEPWSETAWQDAEGARPPLDELVLRVHGLLFLRWLLSRVLSYPTFLMNRYWLASRLGATPASVEAALEKGLESLLKPASYTGILSGFSGRRWWRAGVELILWNLSGGKASSPDELKPLFEQKCGVTLVRSKALYSVVCLDEDYRPLPDLCGPEEAVRLQLDDWPAHAEIA
jgi:hypothetical protein